ncbi:MAG: Mu-like prophage major head subunit gpT family protein [Methylorubrum populi]
MPPDLVTRRASVSAGSYDPETRTFTAVAATGTPVSRPDYFEGGTYDECLSISAQAIRLARFASGRAPILNAHRSGTLADQIGVVTGARIEGGELIVTGQFSERAEVASIGADLAAGVIRNVSVGYRAYASDEKTPAKGRRTVTHVDWEPYELSLVPMPADPNAFIRSAGGHMEPENDDIQTRSAPQDPPANRPALDVQTRAERLRVGTITDIATRGRLGPAVLQAAIDGGTSVEDFRAQALDAMARRAEGTPTGATARSHFQNESLDNPDFMARSIEGALFSRMSGAAPEGAAREFMGKRLLDIGADLLRARGERVDLARPDRIATGMMERGGMHGTGDFPLMLGNVMNRRLLDLFKAAEGGAARIAAPGTAKDFRPQNEGRLSSFPELEKVNEHGEIKFGTLDESGESIAIASYGKGIGVTFQVLVNDDLGAVDRSIRDIGFATGELKSKLILAALAAKLSDGKTVFHADHGNLGLTGPISIDAAGAGRLAMRNQTALDKRTKLGISPKFILVPNELETAADRLVAPISPTRGEDTNPFAGKLEVLVEPRLSEVAP